MLKKLVAALTFGIAGPAAYALGRWSINKEILAAPVFLIALIMVGLGLAFGIFFDSPKKTASDFVKMGVFGVAFILAGLAVGAVDKAWPAEPVNFVPEVEKWQVIDEDAAFGGFGGLIIAKIHQDPNNPNKLGVTVWFSNKDKNYEYEVFVRMVDFVKNILGANSAQAKVSIKLQNGNWSEFAVRQNALMSRGLLNGELAVIFRAVDDNGETKYFRAFLLKDLTKPKN